MESLFKSDAHCYQIYKQEDQASQQYPHNQLVKSPFQEVKDLPGEISYFK